MASSDLGVQMSGWFFGIPTFNPGALFTYFNDLAVVRTWRNTPQAIINAKQSLHEAATSYAESQAAALQKTMQDDARIATALDFLLQVARSEQSKEIKVLKQYRDLLKKALPHDKNIDKYLDEFSADVLQAGDVKHLEQVYKHIVQYITVIRTNAEDYKERLENFKKHRTMTMKDIQDDDFRTRMAGEIHAIENSITGQADKRQKDDEAVYASLLRSAVGDYAVSSNVINKLQSGEDIVACLVAIAIDIENFMRKKMYEKKKTTAISAFTKEELKLMFKNFLLTEEREQTRLERAIEENEEELNDILTATKGILGIETQYLSQATRTKRKNKYNRQKNKNDSIINKLVDNNLDEEKLDDLLSTTFSATGSSTMHGNIFELISVVLQDHGLKVSGSAATDTLTLGSIMLELNNNFDVSILMSAVRKVAKAFTNYANDNRRHRFYDQQDAFERMNSEAQTATKEINQILKNLEAEGLDVEDIFIYHDSLKLYKSAETSEVANQKFHGRDLGILSYIDEVYSLNGMADLAVQSKEALQFLALNIPDGAVASKQKGTVASFLGMFAGMLMFDDIINMAKEAVTRVNQQENGPQARNIHLYNLNGFYVPGSMILRYTYEAMKSFNHKLLKLGAKAEISTSAASQVITDWLKGNWRHGEYTEDYDWAARSYYSANEWARVGEAVAGGINVRIAFFAGFASFIQGLP